MITTGRATVADNIECEKLGLELGFNLADEPPPPPKKQENSLSVDAAKQRVAVEHTHDEGVSWKAHALAMRAFVSGSGGGGRSPNEPATPTGASTPALQQNTRAQTRCARVA